MNPGKVSSSFHSAPSRPYSKHLSIPEHWNIASLASNPLFSMEFKSRERTGHLITFKFLSWRKVCQSEECRGCSVQCWKMAAPSLNLSHNGSKHWSNVLIYFDEFCFPSKKTSSDEPREEMAAQTITEPPPKFLLKMFLGAIFHHGNNI